MVKSDFRPRPYLFYIVPCTSMPFSTLPVRDSIRINHVGSLDQHYDANVMYKPEADQDYSADFEYQCPERPSLANRSNDMPSAIKVTTTTPSLLVGQR